MRYALGVRRHIANPVLGETVTFRRTAAETGGALSELELTLVPGGGNPFHSHTSYSETFTAIEGDLSLGLAGGRTVVLRPGESYEVEAGRVHRFFNATERPIRFRNDVRPGHAGFENALRILCGLAGDGLYDVRRAVPKSPVHLAVVGVMSDMRLPGAMALTTPLLKLLAAWARRRGIEGALIARYCD